MTGYFKTIADLERATYGAFGGDRLLKATGALTGIEGSHHNGSTVGNSTQLYNIVYGQKVWSMINREINALSMLPKKPWKSSGWRILKSRALGGGDDVMTVSDSATLGGVAENIALSSITNIRPEYDVLSLSPKTVAHTFEVSEIAQLMGGLDDGIGDIMQNYREEVGITHAEVMNKMILLDLTATAGEGLRATGFSEAEREANLTSLYHIISDFNEITAAEAEASPNTLTNALEIFGTERTSSLPHLDSFVDRNSGTDRALTVNLLNTTLRQLMARGADPKVILTGYDTIQTLGELLQAQERFMGRSEIVPTHSGIKGVAGREVGFRVATYHDIPIIPVKDMPNGGAGLSDMLILDTDHLFLCTLKPTEYFEGGINADVFGHGKLGHRGLYRTVAETMCTYFRGQGKIIDLE